LELGQKDYTTLLWSESCECISSSKLTPDSVVTYLFHEWKRSLIILLSVAPAPAVVYRPMLACNDQSSIYSITHSIVCVLHVLRVCALFEGL